MKIQRYRPSSGESMAPTPISKSINLPASQTDLTPVGRLPADEAGTKAATYTPYKPVKLGIGLEHPDRIVETASLASVAPPDVCVTECTAVL